MFCEGECPSSSWLESVAVDTACRVRPNSDVRRKSQYYKPTLSTCSFSNGLYTNLDAPLKQVLCFRANGTSEYESEGSAHLSDTRESLRTVVQSKQGHSFEAKHVHQCSMMDSHLSSVAGLSSHTSVAVMAAEEGSDDPNRSFMRDPKWLDSMQMDLEQLNSELNETLLTETYFRPQLRPTGAPGEGNSEVALKSQMRLQQGMDSVEHASISTRSRGPKELTESSLEPTTCPANVGPRVGDGTMNETVLELSDICDSDNEDGKADVPTVNAQRARLNVSRTSARQSNKEMKECTFRPRLAPVSIALSQKMSQSRGSVFERLYPHPDRSLSLCTTGSDETRALLLQERERLRGLCGVTTAEQAGGDTYELFLRNVLGRDSERAYRIVESDYCSPLARELHARKMAAALNSAAQTTATPLPEDEACCLSSFEEFLMRQQMHNINRLRTVQCIEKAQKPSFQPKVTQMSKRIAKELRARSASASSSPKDISSLAAAVKKHQSPYVDQCTFAPKITRVSRAMEPRGTDVMLLDGRRKQNALKAAQERAKEAEMRHPFAPNINRDPNMDVESTLSKKNLQHYVENLRLRREREQLQREEMEMEKERQVLQQSTFQPALSRAPAYVSRMAAGFALVRRHYSEL
ncbi:hypothetical protein TRVL_03472 [Trypanosoma vivax]|nr:hypothetical protein TRVL_03472 [Trypanosoma vivax]